MKKITVCMLAAAAMAFISGCAMFASDNNYLDPEDFAVYLERDGLKVDKVRKLPPDPFLASAAVGIEVGGSEIGVYKYDRVSSVQKKRIEELEKKGRTYINGVPYPIKVNGSFMFFGLDRNPQKRAILKTIDKFN